MAFEEVATNLTFLTGVDLSAYQYCGVKMNPALANSVIPVVAPTDVAIGILQDHLVANTTGSPTGGIGRAASVCIGGGSKVVCGGTLNIGDRFNFNASGQAVTVVGGNVWSMGFMREAGAVGTIASCVVEPTGTNAMLEQFPQDQFTSIPTNTPLALTTGFAGADINTINLTAPLSAAGTVTTPSAAAIVAAINAVPGATAYVGQTFIVKIANIPSSGGAVWTLAAGAGVTLSGTLTINQNTYREFLVTLTSLTAVTVQATGITGTAS